MLWAVSFHATDAGFRPDPYRLLVALIPALPSAMLLFFSMFGVATYLLFVPSVKDDGHVLSRVHGAYLLHPVTTSVIGLLTAACVAVGDAYAFIFLGVTLILYGAHTYLLVRRIHKEEGSHRAGSTGALFTALSLAVGGDIITRAGGAKPIAPWRITELPEDTWIVDVRTKPEFHWNRLSGAKSVPWGEDLVSAAADVPRNRPVLVTCFSGHRSPSAAVTLARMGFTRVYNLSWGILYLILLTRGKKESGPFSLTRPHRNPHRRGLDHKAISIAYVALILLTLIGAPIEWLLSGRPLVWQTALPGAVLAVMGLAVAVSAFKGLGRNFRVYAAPRRSGTLITTGIYSRIRHPMYTGVIVGLGGYVLFFAGLVFLPAWIAVTLLYLVKSVKEEQILTGKFPEYEEYRKRSWRFLPHVH